MNMTSMLQAKFSRSVRAILCALVIGMIASTSLVAQPGDPIGAEFKAIQQRISSKLSSGPRTAEAVSQEIAEIDALLAKYPEITESAARVAYAKAMLYEQVFEDSATADQLLLELERKYAGTMVAFNAGSRRSEKPDKSLRAAAKALAGPAPEMLFDWSTTGGLQKLSDLKGRVVVLDFWATWCGPCIATFPGVRQKAAHFADSPVTILGVTSLQGFVILNKKRINAEGDSEKEFKLLAEFVKAMDMTWPVAICDEKSFKDYGVLGIPHVTIIAPDGTVRQNALHPGRDAKLIDEQVISLLREFNLPVPTSD